MLFVDDGDILTSAGVAAGIDLCLHVVRRDHGAEVANRAARRCVVPPWRDGGQAQFIERPLPAGDGAASTAATRAWALERLGEPLTLTALAAHARMSVRTFTRRFREETGLSPAPWLLQQRTDHARRLLETTGARRRPGRAARRLRHGGGVAATVARRDRCVADHVPSHVPPSHWRSGAGIGDYACHATARATGWPGVRRRSRLGERPPGDPAYGEPTSGGPATPDRPAAAPSTAARPAAGPSYGGPTSGAPGYGSPTSGGPTYGAPTSGGPTYGSPTSGGPTYGSPTSGGPTYGNPTSGARSTAARPAAARVRPTAGRRPEPGRRGGGASGGRPTRADRPAPRRPAATR